MIGLFIFFVLLPKISYAATLYWVGADGADASVASNWKTTNPATCGSGDSLSAPVSGDIVNFDADCDNNAVIDSSFTSSVTTLTLNSGYVGTVTQSNDLTVSGTFTVTGGTWDATTKALTLSVFTINGGTFTQTSGSFSTSGALTVSSGSLTLINGADLNGSSSTVAFAVSGGTVVFPTSGSVTLAGGFKITNSPTITGNSAILTFDAAAATIDCNSTNFTTAALNFAFNNSGTKTVGVSGNCSLPIGASPTLAGAGGITLTGTLSGTGTLTRTSGALTISGASAVLSGFSALSVSALTLSGTTPVLDLSSYTSFTAVGTTTVTTGTLTLSSTANTLAGLTVNGGVVTQSAGTFTASSTVNLSVGSLTLANGADLNGSLVISGGTFNAPSGTMTLAGALTISGTPIFNANGGTITLDGSAATLSCNNVIFNLIIFTSISGKTINSNCNLPLGSNPTIPGSITLNGTLSGTGTLTEGGNGSGTFTLNSGAQLSGFTGYQSSQTSTSTAQLTISGATIDFSNYSPVNTGQFTVSSGTFTAPSGIMRVYSALLLSGGTFNHNNGTVIVTFLPTSTTTTRNITGSTTFNNFQIIPTLSGRTYNFEAGTTQTILGTLTLGSSGNPVNLRSSVSGTQWNINAQGSRALSNLDVKDSNNINSNPMTAVFSNDSGNNTNWLFSNTSISFFLDYPGGNQHITQTRPTFRWKKATASVNSSIVKYQLWVDNGDTGDFNIDNIVPFVSDVNSNNKTLEYNRYTIHDDGDFLNLTTKSSNLWPSNMNDGVLTLGKKNWRIVAFDSAGNIQENSVDFFVDSVTSTTTSPVTTTNTNQNIILTNEPNQSNEIPTETTPPVSEPSASLEPTPTTSSPDKIGVQSGQAPQSRFLFVLVGGGVILFFLILLIKFRQSFKT